MGVRLRLRVGTGGRVGPERDEFIAQREQQDRGRSAPIVRAGVRPLILLMAEGIRIDCDVRHSGVADPECEGFPQQRRRTGRTRATERPDHDDQAGDPGGGGGECPARRLSDLFPQERYPCLHEGWTQLLTALPPAGRGERSRHVRQPCPRAEQPTARPKRPPRDQGHPEAWPGRLPTQVASRGEQGCDSLPHDRSTSAQRHPGSSPRALQLLESNEGPVTIACSEPLALVGRFGRVQDDEGLGRADQAVTAPVPEHLRTKHIWLEGSQPLPTSDQAGACRTLRGSGVCVPYQTLRESGLCMPPGEIPQQRIWPHALVDVARTLTDVDPWHSRGYPVSTHRSRVLTAQRREGMAKKDFNLKPLEDRIVVKPGEEEETTVSGIVIPDTAKEKPQEGSVVAVGPRAVRGRAAGPARRRGRRHRHLLEVRRHRGQGRGRGVPDPFGPRRPGRHRQVTGPQERSDRGRAAHAAGPRSVIEGGRRWQASC